MKRFLITTADERTWPRDQPVLFLGEWCKLYHRRHVWAAMDTEMVPYHWDDRKKLYRDYLCLQGLCEELLLELSERLNSLHSVNHSLRYWRILVGPWLGYFVQMLFDRWEMIQRAITDYSLAGARVLETADEHVVPNDMDHFQCLFIEDAWNEAIYGQLFQGWSAVPIEKVQPDMQSPLLGAQPVLSPVRRLKRGLARAASIVSQIFVREDGAFFLTTYLPIQQDLLLQWRLGQAPLLWRPFPTPKAKVDWTQRQWKLGRAGVEGFPAIVRAMIPRHIPTLYMEGYAVLQAFCDALPWPKKPRLIFTSNSYGSDDVFKSWAAEKVEACVPLVIGQHGGLFGIGRWDSTEDHQCAISDGWLSWGWRAGNRPQIIPVSNLKMIGVDMGWNPEGYALMVGMAMHRYSAIICSTPLAGQWLDYFNDQCRFFDALPDEIRRRFLVRLYLQDYGWGQAARWREHFPDLRLDEGRVPIASLIKKSRLYISTYNATTFLESLTMNVPTIMFWNPLHWELRDRAVPCFERLKAVGIFHETPESAAEHTTRVWDDVAAWWKSDSVQTVRKEFCYRYSRMSERPLEDLEQVLRQISHYTLP